MIDARGGVLIRYEFPAPGPALHFFLCELRRPHVAQIIRLWLRSLRSAYHPSTKIAEYDPAAVISRSLRGKAE